MAASANDRMSEHLCLPLWPNLQPPLCPSASEVLKTPVFAMGRDPGAVQSGPRGRSHQAIRKSEKGGPTRFPSRFPSVASPTRRPRPGQQAGIGAASGPEPRLGSCEQRSASCRGLSLHLHSGPFSVRSPAENYCKLLIVN